MSEIVLHPNFTGDGVGPNDIALLRLSVTLTFNDFIQPAELPVNDSVSSGVAVVSGWGAISEVIIPINAIRLRSAILNILSNKGISYRLIAYCVFLSCLF